MKMQWSSKLAGALAIATVSAFLPFAQAARTANPGTVNYIEGQISVNGNPLTSKQAGEAQMEPNQILSTSHGKAEVLLTPGVFLRAGNNTDVRLVSNELTNPTIEVLRGEAMLEVDQKPKASSLEVLQGGFNASVQKEGLYRFDADESKIGVFDGKLKVTGAGFDKDLKKGHELVLNGALQSNKFDTKNGDELYRWSQLRSEYMAQANEASARTVYVNNLGYGGGWYWNPYFTSWAWLPGNGYFYSPFGYPFYSPGYVVYAPTVYGRGVYRGPYRGSNPPVVNRGAIGPRAVGGPAVHGFNRGGGGVQFRGGGVPMGRSLHR